MRGRSTKAGRVGPILTGLVCCCEARPCSEPPRFEEATSAATASVGVPKRIAAAPISSARQTKPLPGRVVCRVEFTGSETLSVEGHWHERRPGGVPPQSMASSDYWMNEADLRKALRLMHGMFSYEGEPDLELRVEQDMKNNPRFTPLSLSCHDDREVGVDLAGFEALTYQQVPFKPSTYRIRDSFGSKDSSAVFSARIATPGEAFYESAGGRLVLRRFDDTGVSGAFSLDARPRSEDGTLHIEGTFDFPCNGLGESLCRAR